MIPRGSNDKKLTNANSIATTSFVPALVSLLSLLPPTVISWLTYKCSDVVEQSVTPGGRNERLTNADTHDSQAQTQTWYTL